MNMTVDKVAGLIVLGVAFYWIFRDAAGTNQILTTAAQQNAAFVGALRGGGYSTGGYQGVPASA